MLKEHCAENRQMAFLCGPRQVGKTTTAKRLSGERRYLNWDAPETRVVVRNGKPWFLVEVKTGEDRELNRNLYYYQQATGAQHAFQVAVNAAFVDADCFAETAPVRVPASTFLSQLI